MYNNACKHIKQKWNLGQRLAILQNTIETKL